MRSGEIHGPPVVRVHKAQVPDLAALVEVRHPRRSDLEQRLGEGVEHAQAVHIAGKLQKGADKGGIAAPRMASIKVSIASS